MDVLSRDASLDANLFGFLHALQVDVGEREFAPHLAQLQGHESAETATCASQENMIFAYILLPEDHAVLSQECQDESNGDEGPDPKLGTRFPVIAI